MYTESIVWLHSDKREQEVIEDQQWLQSKQISLFLSPSLSLYSLPLLDSSLFICSSKTSTCCKQLSPDKIREKDILIDVEETKIAQTHGVLEGEIGQHGVTSHQLGLSPSLQVQLCPSQLSVRIRPTTTAILVCWVSTVRVERCKEVLIAREHIEYLFSIFFLFFNFYPLSFGGWTFSTALPTSLSPSYTRATATPSITGCSTIGTFTLTRLSQLVSSSPSPTLWEQFRDCFPRSALTSLLRSCSALIPFTFILWCLHLWANNQRGSLAPSLLFTCARGAWRRRSLLPGASARGILVSLSISESIAIVFQVVKPKQLDSLLDSHTHKHNYYGTQSPPQSSHFIP